MTPPPAVAAAPVDMSIPGAAIVSDPMAAPAPEPTSWATGSKPNYLGGGIALIVIVVGLLAWRPWKATNGDVAVQTTTDSAMPVFNPMGSSLVTPVSASTPPETVPAGLTQPIAARTPELPAAAEPGPVPDTPVDSTKEDVVLAAGNTNFGGGVGTIDVVTEATTGAATSAIAPSELVRRLEAGQREVQQELNSRLGTIGFRGVINPARLSTPALLAAATTAWSGGVEAIRNYRSRIARMEKAYEDSVLAVQRTQRWSAKEMSAWASRQSLAEPSDASQLSDLMFAQVSEGLEILTALPGDYSIKGDKISFKNATSATRYTSIRGWAEQRMATWSATPESARPYSISAMLRALGDGFPAVE